MEGTSQTCLAELVRKVPFFVGRLCEIVIHTRTLVVLCVYVCVWWPASNHIWKRLSVFVFFGESAVFPFISFLMSTTLFVDSPLYWYSRRDEHTRTQTHTQWASSLTAYLCQMLEGCVTIASDSSMIVVLGRFQRSPTFQQLMNGLVFAVIQVYCARTVIWSGAGLNSFTDKVRGVAAACQSVQLRLMDEFGQYFEIFMEHTSRACHFFRVFIISRIITLCVCVCV